MDAKTHRQQAALASVHGQPVIALSFYGYSDGHVSMWQHTNHAEDYERAKKLLIAMQLHLTQFIDDGAMCPFNPEFHQLDTTD